MLVTSDPLLGELRRVLAYPRLAGTIGEPGELVRLLSEVAVVVEPEVTVIEHDPTDNRVLEAAVAAQADYIVSGDTDLPEIASFEGVRIVSPREFIAAESP
jgi:putative PIN family toxin of toxin-antitoxin system